MSQALEAIQLDTGPNPQHCVIWMHGLGADGNDFAPVVPELGLPPPAAIRFLFPHAPMQPVTINGGMVMRAWYDILATDLARRADETGLRNSQHLIEDMLAHVEQSGIKSANTVLAGFSQGGAIALQTGLRYRERIAGIMALSTYLPLAETVAAERSAANRQVPIFMAHGMQDPVISFAHAKASRDQLVELGYPVEWHEYPMPHSVCLEELQAIGAWLRKVLAI
jgi:phospholipase/carboxylesterase